MPDREGPKWTDIAIVGLTLAIVFLAYMQWREMHGSGEQTDRIIAADERFAVAMERTVSQGQTSFDKTLAEMQKQSLAMQANVDVADRNTKTTISNAQAAFRDEQRAWVAVGGMRVVDFEPKEPITIDLTVTNTGRTPARNVKLRVRTNLSDVPIDGPSPSELSELRKAPWEPQPATAPQSNFVFTVGRLYTKGKTATEENQKLAQAVMDRFELIKSRAMTMYDYGELTYQDVSGRQHRSTFCFFLADPDTKAISLCRDFNDID